jgi:hypothetical protein
MPQMTLDQDVFEPFILTDQTATNGALRQWWLTEMGVVEQMKEDGQIAASNDGIGLVAKGLWNIAYLAGQANALAQAGEGFVKGLDPETATDIYDPWDVREILAIAGREFAELCLKAQGFTREGEQQ